MAPSFQTLLRLRLLPKPYRYASHVCGRTTSKASRDELVRLFQVDEVDASELPIRTARLR